MSKAFSLITKNENILFSSKDVITRIYLEEYVLKDNIFPPDALAHHNISSIVLDHISDIDSIDLSKINFTNDIKVFIKRVNINQFRYLSIKYFENDLGYTKTNSVEEYSKYNVLYFNRNMVKSQYLSDIEDSNTIKIHKQLSNYCDKKKYFYKKYISSDLYKSISRLEKVKTELIDTMYLLVIYKYSAIINWTFNIEKFVKYNILANYSISLDRGSTMFHNFLVKNNKNTFNIIDELLTSFRQNNIENYIDSPNTGIYINNSNRPIFNLEKYYNSPKTINEYLVNFNNLSIEKPGKDLDILLNHYLNSHKYAPESLYPSVYLKAYSWGILDKGVIGFIKFRFKGLLEYLNGEGTYKKITESNYLLEFGEFSMHITFNSNLDSFTGYDTTSLAEIVGFLHNKY